MQVKELIEKLQQLDQSAAVVLLPKNSGIINPIVSITGAWSGFDWWDGMVVLKTDRDITADFSDIFNKDALHLKKEYLESTVQK